MPYIGNTPALDYISYAVQNFTVTAGTTSYALDYSVANENDIRLVINNVIQRPGASFAYSATGTTLTLTSATLATDTMYAVFIGRAVQTVTPPTNSVGLSQLTATGTKNSTTFLRGDNTFATVSTTPTIQRFTSGSGTYTTPSGVKYLIVEMSGAGGGGAGGAVGSQTTTGGNGGNSSFGTALHTAGGGTGGGSAWSGNGGLGGGLTLGAGATSIFTHDGTRGGGSVSSTASSNFSNTGEGGGNPFNGGAVGSTYISAGIDGITSTGGGGAGGGGGSSSGTIYGGSGGGGGGYMKFLISSPSATYAYAIGSGGTAGTGGSGANGGAGGSGIIIVTEYYN